ncbi:anthranilate synthase component I [Lederbergia sp. NSJ-179]|uniref:anthranilate synthase component I n=1 Tax=Lederbergia sp. NSJ-179 TaxID=2931402 RepID=UPI001FD2C2C2|nr:anthranilate synthase component I [Lederbergia sp. NSJ-179]MCJ7841448.1 anthranilate synthase component I [Lederbergia sp. NSJ-179]
MSILSNFEVQSEEEIYTTKSGIQVTRSVTPLPPKTAMDNILNQIDHRKGALLSSSYEYPGRYTRWDIGFINPVIEIRSYANTFTIHALNQRGTILLEEICEKLNTIKEITFIESSPTLLTGVVNRSDELFMEEERTRQPSIFTVIRAIQHIFASGQDHFLGLYGAFGYDLVFHLEAMELHHERNEEKPDLVLYIPDELTIVDHQRGCAYSLSYDFDTSHHSTKGLPREGAFIPYNHNDNSLEKKPYQKGKYAKLVEKAIDSFRKGDLFEVVPSHSFYETCSNRPSEIFAHLRSINPSPYGFIVNLGTEYLVGCSPEMYVRVEGDRIETCPISGTIKRGNNAVEDADRILELLNSAKDEAELTMCTDVDRNDKSRICLPGSVKVIGRRQLEMYSHLIHTVDHVEGYLKPEHDALDAFITHMWAVTVTGAPKRNAIKWIEKNEDSPRGWYGGAVGYLTFDGNLNTGLTLRTMNIKDGLATIRVGATLLVDSIPKDEEEETITKAAALIQALKGARQYSESSSSTSHVVGKGKKVLIVDHEDSFVHTLGNYFKQTGAEVFTARIALAKKILKETEKFDLVVLSPGPGTPSDFSLKDTINLCIQNGIPIFGVCLGLQGIVEYFGGTLDYQTYPQHGKSSIISVTAPSKLWNGIEHPFEASRYHSLYAKNIPECLKVTAISEDGIVMALEHETLPISAVQFHPESILTTRNNIGLKIIENIIRISTE